jgi:uncharacterized protein (TIRG00374 family)
MSPDLRRKFLISLVIALLVYIALALYSDWNQLTAALSDFPWVWLIPVVGLTLLNYCGRALRWHWYLRLLDVPISLRDSSRIFGIGLLMVMTPGKAGEFLKCYMVKNVAGTPMSVTAPVILAERLLDGAAMLLLAAVGLFAFPNQLARWVAVLVFGNFVILVMIIQTRPLALALLRWLERMPVVNRFASHFHAAYESAYLIFGPRNLFLSLLIGVFCWSAEGIAYYVVLRGFGVPASGQALLMAVFIFCISTVIGALFAMPGGLGGVEGSLVALSVQLFALPVATATAAALLIRFCTLWLGVLVGVVSFALWPNLLAGAEQVRREPAPATGEL